MKMSKFNVYVKIFISLLISLSIVGCSSTSKKVGKKENSQGSLEVTDELKVELEENQRMEGK